MLIIQYATYEHLVERYSIAKLLKTGVCISRVKYSSIQTPKILRVMGHVQTVRTRPFLGLGMRLGG